MARPSEPKAPVLTPSQIRRCIEQLQSCIGKLEAFVPPSGQRRDLISAVIPLKTSIKEALDAAFGYRTRRHNLYKPPVARINTALHHRPGSEIDYDARDWQKIRESSIELLRAAIHALESDIKRMAEGATITSPSTAASASHGRKVFLVHGRDDATKNEVDLFLNRIGLEPIILHTRPHGGRNILMKFQEESQGAGFAVILMTPDDEGALIGEAAQKRARQNVVFEFGFFIGKLGTPSVAALVKGRIEKPSDFDGIGYIDFDAKGEWKRLLAREMHHAQIPFDASKVLTA